MILWKSGGESGKSEMKITWLMHLQLENRGSKIEGSFLFVVGIYQEMLVKIIINSEEVESKSISNSKKLELTTPPSFHRIFWTPSYLPRPWRSIFSIFYWFLHFFDFSFYQKKIWTEGRGKVFLSHIPFR